MMNFVQDLINDIKNLNEIRPPYIQIKLKYKLYDIIQFHASLKQLSDSNSFSKKKLNIKN